MTSSRPYHSPHRARAAAQTRAAILGSAHRLFLRDGYARVTVADIAADAGVAVKTVYASAGSKSDLLDAIVDAAVAASEHEATIARVRTKRTMAAVTRELAHGTRTGNENGREVLTIVRNALGVHEGAAALSDRAFAAYRSQLHAVAEHMSSLTSLPESTDRVADLLWLWFGPESWRVLVEDCGWSWDETEDRLYANALAVLTSPTT
ncbi:TetR/AcrR family transcriptional regulator [Actinoallomurus purpureus]|uniref:TetR/AcrR family transcriptional regulator n=1 Tax=Actinoallomurus purpureus TaxID=478114 RepID=UPI002092F003|nr:TetR/AcrR family transcriptional regulator [Actinoallomurus purpureus]